ncbi:MAG TPA: hypothetical protein VHQ65_00785, partial [Thermoanaerobaculia bacterium]|nr:hypothetical protein [Thermoanaerobaculia bacterium]
LRTDPVVLTAAGGLAGLAWLEGDRRGALGVRFARWTGERWTRPEPVAAPGPGTQIALAGTRLADGSLLLLWAAYDGEDDEILWSRRGADGTWSRPHALGFGNSVPDVTPAVTALPGGGALAAWSRFDEASAQYLVMAARFDDGAWSAPHAVAPPGTAFPSFEATPDDAATPRLLVRTAAPRGWAVLELDADGRPRRVAHAEAAAPDRPRVEDAAGGVDLRWPGTGRASRALAWEILP